MAPNSWHPISGKDWKSKKKRVQNLWCKNILKPSNHIKVAKLTLARQWPNFGYVNANATTTFPRGFGAIPLKQIGQSRWGLPDSKVGEVFLTICPKRNPRTARKTPTFFRKTKKTLTSDSILASWIFGGFPCIENSLEWKNKNNMCFKVRGFS